MENEQMTTELQYQSRETERLLKMNTKLRSDNKNLKRWYELISKRVAVQKGYDLFKKEEKVPRV
jgi:hypothetical protein